MHLKTFWYATNHAVQSLSQSSDSMGPLTIVTTPQGADDRLVRLVYLGSLAVCFEEVLDDVVAFVHGRLGVRVHHVGELVLAS